MILLCAEVWVAPIIVEHHWKVGLGWIFSPAGPWELTRWWPVSEPATERKQRNAFKSHSQASHLDGLYAYLPAPFFFFFNYCSQKHFRFIILSIFYMHSWCIKYIHIVILLSPRPHPHNSCQTYKTFTNSHNCSFYLLNKNSASPRPRPLATIIILSAWVTVTIKVPHTRGIAQYLSFGAQPVSLSIPVSFLSTVPLWTFLYRIPQRVTIRRNSNTWLTEIKTETHSGVTSQAEIAGKFRMVIWADAFPNEHPSGGLGPFFQQMACRVKG